MKKVCKECQLKEVYIYGRCFSCHKKRKYKKNKEYREKNAEKIRKQKKEAYNSGIEIKCLGCEKTFMRPKYIIGSKYCSHTCQSKHWKRTGERKRKKNPAWKNGSHSTTYKKIFLEYINEKGIDLLKVGCQICGNTTSPAYDIHHIVFRSEAPRHEALNTPVNMIYLCRSCHNFLHGSKRKNRKYLVIERGLEKIFNRKLYDRD